MNILIFDTQNKLWQFEAGKSWAGLFTLNPELYSNDSAVVQSLLDEKVIQNPPSSIKSFDLSKTTRRINPSALAPSSSYGITIIDCVGKIIGSMNEYTEMCSVLNMEIGFLFMKNVMIAGKNERLEKIKTLIENQLFSTGDEKIDAQILSDIKSHEKKEEIQQNKNIYNLLEPSLRLCKKNTPWRSFSCPNYDDNDIYEGLTAMLDMRGVYLTKKQEAQWVSFASEATNGDFNLTVFDEKRIQEEKEKLSRRVPQQAGGAKGKKIDATKSHKI